MYSCDNEILYLSPDEYIDHLQLVLKLWTGAEVTLNLKMC